MIKLNIRRLMQEGFCEFKTSPDYTVQMTTKANFKYSNFRNSKDTILVKVTETNKNTL